MLYFNEFFQEMYCKLQNVSQFMWPSIVKSSLSIMRSSDQIYHWLMRYLFASSLFTSNIPTLTETRLVYMYVCKDVGGFCLERWIEVEQILSRKILLQIWEIKYAEKLIFIFCSALGVSKTLGSWLTAESSICTAC